MSILNRVIKAFRTDSYIAQTWQNEATGMGGIADRLSHQIPAGVYPLSPEILSTLSYDPFGRRIISALPKESFRCGMSPSYHGENQKDADLVSVVEKRLESMRWVQRSREAATWGRLYGGSCVLMVTDDGELLAPLEANKNTNVYSMMVLDGYVVRPDQNVIDLYDPRANKRFPEHEYYTVVSGTLGTVKVHNSRVAVFPGILTSYLDRWRYFSGWDASALQPVWDLLRSMSSNRQSIGAMLFDSSTGVLKIPNMWNAVTGSYKDKLKQRLAHLDLYKSNIKTIPIDAGEDYNYVSRSFAGIKDVSENDQVLVAAASEMPVTVLFGRSPAGENSTGQHDSNNWRAISTAAQRNIYGEPCVAMVRTVAASEGATDLDGWSITWPNLEVLSLHEQADLEKKHAEADVQRNVLGYDAIELLKWRYGSREYKESPPMLSPDQADEMDRIQERFSVEPTAPIEPSSGEEGSEAMPEQKTETEAILAELKVVEQLVKSGTPDPVIRALVARIAERLGVSTSEVLRSIAGAEFKWYTTPVIPGTEEEGL